MGKFLLMGTFLLMAPGPGPGPWGRAGPGPDLSLKEWPCCNLPGTNRQVKNHKKIRATGLARTPSLQCGSSGHLGRHEDLRDDSAFGSRICIAISNDVRASKNDRIESDRWENL